MIPASILILMGVSGTGKTTVGKLLAQQLGWPFFDGDDFHPPANIAKMSDGIPLTDQDRELWLQALAGLIEDVKVKGGHAVLAASLLKRAYRESVIGERPGIQPVYLKADAELVKTRLQLRKEHFFKADLLLSQFEILEEPSEAEGALVITVDSPPEVIAARIKASIAESHG